MSETTQAPNWLEQANERVLRRERDYREWRQEQIAKGQFPPACAPACQVCPEPATGRTLDEVPLCEEHGRQADASATDEPLDLEVELPAQAANTAEDAFMGEPTKAERIEAEEWLGRVCAEINAGGTLYNDDCARLLKAWNEAQAACNRNGDTIQKAAELLRAERRENADLSARLAAAEAEVRKEAALAVRLARKHDAARQTLDRHIAREAERAEEWDRLTAERDKLKALCADLDAVLPGNIALLDKARVIVRQLTQVRECNARLETERTDLYNHFLEAGWDACIETPAEFSLRHLRAQQPPDGGGEPCEECRELERARAVMCDVGYGLGDAELAARSLAKDLLANQDEVRRLRTIISRYSLAACQDMTSEGVYRVWKRKRKEARKKKDAAWRSLVNATDEHEQPGFVLGAGCSPRPSPPAPDPGAEACGEER